VLVGPGRYGDVNDDNALGDPGDEPGTCVTPPAVDAFWTCLIEVDKAVNLLSRDGAAATIIDVSDTRKVGLMITAAATVGKLNKGFTFTHATAGLMNVSAGVKIGGNISEDNLNGFIDENLDAPHAEYADNRASNNIVGIIVQGSAFLTGNVARGNFTGFSIPGDDAGPDPAPKPSLAGNLAVTNYTGFQFIDAEPASFTGNAAIGNITNGISVDGGSMPVLRKTSVFASGVCGIDSNVPVDATDVYWGASTGPGPDPADDACGTVDTSAWRPAEVRVAPKPLR
jgi:hypothetical protein